MSVHTATTSIINERAIDRQEKGRSNTGMLLRRLGRSPSAIAGGVIIVAFVSIALLATVYTPHDPSTQSLRSALQGPSPRHWLGTDEFGRDILSRIMAGTIPTFGIAVLGVSIGIGIGVTLGSLAGYFGGLFDTIVMRLIDVQLAIPGIILAIVIITVLGIGMLPLILAVGIFSIPGFARVARAGVLITKAGEFVEAAHSIGASNAQVLLRHVMPNTLAPIIVQTSLRTATAILVASSLSFLGLGAQPPSPEWGSMLSTSRDYLQSDPHTAVFPGIAVALAVLGFNLLGDGLRDALDTRLTM
ncbi:MAG: ABC transporter permease [Chloroflexota bacterium]|nr:ABC transporter permease [Chloroflexota bacterium]